MTAKVQRFTVIIVNRNGGAMLERMMAALWQAVRPGTDAVIVVDNASRDDSVSIIGQAYPDVAIIRNACNNGFAAANNQALARATTEYVLLLNSDAFVPSNILERMAMLFETHPRLAVISAQLYTEDGQRQRSSAPFPNVLSECGLRSLRKKQPEMPLHGLVQVDSVVGACMAVRRQAISEVGPLDDDFFFYFEDVEWCHRFKRHGWDVALDCDSHVIHLKGKSTRSLRPDAQIEMLRSRWIYYGKVFPRPVALVLRMWRLLRLTVNCAFHSLAVVASLGLIRPIREKCYIYGLLLGWCLLGCPRRWGLPDKCPDSGSDAHEACG